jgi:hypothetical protein
MIPECAGNEWAVQWAAGVLHFRPTGWMLILVYTATIGVAGRRLAGEIKSGAQKQSVRFWTVVTILLVLMMLNRLFSLQSLATEAARCAAAAEGWYNVRQPFQFAFTVAALVIGGMIVALAGMRRPSWDERLALAGLVALVAIVAARSFSMHQVDSFLFLRISGLSFNGLTEGAALALVLVGALRGAHPLLIDKPPRATPAPSDRDC